MNLRLATNEDLETVISWIHDAAACRIWAGPVVQYPMTIRTLKADIEYKKDNTYCHDAEGHLLAFGQLIRKSGSRLHMARVVIAPDKRSNGHGKRWVHSLMDLAWQKGCRRISLNVYRQNTPALKLYTALGFTEIAEKSTDDLCCMLAENRTTPKRQ